MRGPPFHVLLNTDCDDSDSSLEGLDLDFDGFSTCDSDCDDEDDSVFACSVCLDSEISSSLGFGVVNGINTGSGNDFNLTVVQPEKIWFTNGLPSNR